MNDAPAVRSEEVVVVFVAKKNAKAAKSALEAAGMLNKDYRMVPVTATDSSEHTECIALPVTDAFDIDGINAANQTDFRDLFVSKGVHVCPFSTKMLGNNRRVTSQHAFANGKKLTLVQRAIVNTITALSVKSDSQSAIDNESMIKAMTTMDRVIFPQKMEFFGDDNTLVVPKKSFAGPDFDAFVSSHAETTNLSEFKMELWRQLALLYRCPRVVRRGTVDPESGIRESGHRLLLPHSGISDQTGPGSAGWIKVTEQGIKQSFDLTRVMFSRGNISEKIRFGKLVREGEIVLDLYAGIGYYTLPALVIGKAAHVYSCEWNIHAANALRFNIQDNCVEDRSTVLVGDCRILSKEHNLVDMFDRVCLGLLPSSEGGWSAGVRGIRNKSGGWLHIHSNVPVKEVDSWATWVSSKLQTIATEQGKPKQWAVVCDHIEKVKSFAPTVAHYVADIYLGPADRYHGAAMVSQGQAGVITGGKFQPCPDTIETPSCALSPDNVLSQEWMR